MEEKKKKILSSIKEIIIFVCLQKFVISLSWIALLPWLILFLVMQNHHIKLIFLLFLFPL